eukprot:TRINITY_DN10172_c0_g2_i2.p1 TRINITY_DN10172_c0_g2~~TRINITY_DN10172_c0_g2_i2.p1  ORF type:complete len:490 (-),score=81.86 TRINITY_DN10172_c0_g2_i2:389-1858(-)
MCRPSTCGICYLCLKKGRRRSCWGSSRVLVRYGERCLRSVAMKYSKPYSAIVFTCVASESLSVILIGGVDYSMQPKNDLREFLEKKAKFNNLLQISDKRVISLINMNYRLLFFKDSVAVSWLDDISLSSISDLINENYKVILNYIFTDKTIPDKLMNCLQPAADFKARASAIKFILETFSISMCNSSELRAEFFTAFIEKGLLGCLSEFLRMPQHKVSGELKGSLELVQVWSAEILLHILQTFPLKVRSMLIAKETKEMGHRLLIELLEILFSSSLDGPKFEIGEFYKCLLSPEITYYESSIVDVFYSECMSYVTDFVFGKGLKSCCEGRAISLQIALDLLTYCAHTHNYAMRDYVINSQVLQSIDRLCSHPSKHIRLGGIKFLRSLLNGNDEMMQQYIVSNDLLRPVIALSTKSRSNNVITAAVLELFEFIKRGNSKVLVMYLGDRYEEFIREGPLAGSKTLRELLESYEEYKKQDEYYMGINVEKIM